MAFKSKKGLLIYKRRLPHWRFEGSIYFVTFRLEAGYLRDSEKSLVLDRLITGKGKFYKLFAAVVMPDHVHLLVKPNENFTLSRIIKGIKGVSAREINKSRNTSGQLWQQEYFDRIIRDEKEFLEKMNYLYTNPVRKGLVEKSELWKWMHIDLNFQEQNME